MHGSPEGAKVALLCVLAGALSFGLGLLALSQMRVTAAAARGSPPPTVAAPCRV
jgi:hypothetical protein